MKAFLLVKLYILSKTRKILKKKIDNDAEEHLTSNKIVNLSNRYQQLNELSANTIIKLIGILLQ